MAAPLHTPALQVSAAVQALPALQAVPLATSGFEQAPVSGLQVPAMWHWSGAGQTTVVPRQTPAWQLSAVVQALPSLHAMPFGAGGFEQVPVAGLHVPARWHWSDAAHVTAGPGATPPRPPSPGLARVASGAEGPLGGARVGEGAGVRVDL